MTTPQTLPLLFTLPPSSRHELILLPLTPTGGPPPLKALNQQISTALTTSPNCAEFMGKYKAKPEAGAGGEQKREQILELRMHWSESGRDRRIWPEYTVVTEENWGAVVEVLRVGGGVARDVLEVKVGELA